MSAVPTSGQGAVAAPPRIGWLLRVPYPYRTVARRWRGLIGMVIGVGISLGIGMLFLGTTKGTIQIYTANFVDTGADLYVVQQGGTLVPILPSDAIGPVSNGAGLLSRLRGQRGVKSALGTVLASLARETEGPRRSGEPDALVTVMGVDGDPREIRGMLVLNAGRWIRRPDEVMIGPKLARLSHLAVGDPLRLSGRSFTVVGIGRLRGSSFGTEGYAYMDYQALRQRSGAPDAMNMLVVGLDRASGGDLLVQREELRRRILGMAPVTAYDPQQVVARAEEANSASYVFSWLMISLTLGIAALFVSNMLGRSVAERRVEFATLRALGLPARTVLATVAGEAALIVVLAWVFGIVMSWGLGSWTNQFVLEEYGLENTEVPDPPLFGVLFALSVTIGIIAGLVPARQATSVDPVEVLRDA